MMKAAPYRQNPSPNHGERRDGAAIEMVILHYTGMESAEGALAWLANPASQVSSHYFVFENGEVVQLVPEDRRAWHAGVSGWEGIEDVNSSSIGIEIANPGHEFGYRDFPDAQIEALIELLKGIIERHGVPARNILAHSDVAPERKQDPGEKFPWGRLAAAGIGLHVEPVPVRPGPALKRGDRGREVLALQVALKRYGYALSASGIYDPATEAVVAAFQRHFRPERVDGAADPSTVETLERLLAAAGV